MSGGDRRRAERAPEHDPRRADPARDPDPQRITEVRRALADGRYEVDPRLVAEAMIRAGALTPPDPPAHPD